MRPIYLQASCVHPILSKYSFNFSIDYIYTIDLQSTLTPISPILLLIYFISYDIYYKYLDKFIYNSVSFNDIIFSAKS